MTTALIADDEADIRVMLRLMLRMESGEVEVVAEAADGDEVVRIYETLGSSRPDVLVLDNRMPGLSGLDAAARILRDHPEQAVLLFSAELDDTIRDAASDLGIRACVRKDQLDQIPQLIRVLAA